MKLLALLNLWPPFGRHPAVAGDIVRICRKPAKPVYAFRGSTGSVMRASHARPTSLTGHMEGGG